MSADRLSPHDAGPDPRALWQAESPPAPPFLPAVLRARATRHAVRLRWLARAQLAGAVVGALGFIAFALWLTDPRMRAGSAILAIDFVYILVLLPRGRVHDRPNDGSVPAEPSLAFYRTALAHQRDLARGTRLWARLAIGLPGVLLFFAGFTRAYPALAPVLRLELAVILVALGTTFALSRRRAARYQREIEALGREAIDADA